jgi:hypothetical protein
MSSTKRKIEETVTRPYELKLEQQRKAIHEFVDRDSTSIVMQYMPEMVPFSVYLKFYCVLSDIRFNNWFNLGSEMLRGRYQRHSYHLMRCDSCVYKYGRPDLAAELRQVLIEILAGVHKIKFD